MIKSNISFRCLTELAKRHRVSSLVRGALKFYTPLFADEEKALRELQIACLTTAALNNFYRKDLLTILYAFGKKGIPVIPLKGIILSERLYGDTISRDQSVDLDLLVKEEDVGRSRELLEGAGYVYGRADEAEEYKWFCNFTKPKAQTIELHWDITMMVRSRERIDALWRTARIAKKGVVGYYDLAPEELLLYLSAHLVSSGAFRQLRHICDIDRLIRKYGSEIDWDSVVRKAKSMRLSGSLYASLKLVKDLYGILFPHKLFSELKAPLPGRLLIKLFADKRVVVSQCLRRRVLDIFLSYVFFELIEALSFRDYSSIFKRIIFPSEKSAKETGYGRRLVKGIVKFVRQLVS